MSNYTYQQLRKRTQYLRGESDYAIDAATAVINDHIIFSVREILNAFPYSWSQVTATGTITGSTSPYTFTLPADYNPMWGIADARIKGASTGGDSVFSPRPFQDQGALTEADYAYWITYNTGTSRYVFNTLTSSGTVTYTYNTIPTDLAADGDICIIPDGEAVCYLAASKMWVGDERNLSLKSDYEQESTARVRAMWANDLQFGALYSESSVIDLNSRLLGQ